MNSLKRQVNDLVLGEKKIMSSTKANWKPVREAKATSINKNGTAMINMEEYVDNKLTSPNLLLQNKTASCKNSSGPFLRCSDGEGVVASALQDAVRGARNGAVRSSLEQAGSGIVSCRTKSKPGSFSKGAGLVPEPPAFISKPPSRNNAADQLFSMDQYNSDIRINEVNNTEAVAIRQNNWLKGMKKRGLCRESAFHQPASSETRGSIIVTGKKRIDCN